MRLKFEEIVFYFTLLHRKTKFYFSLAAPHVYEVNIYAKKNYNKDKFQFTMLPGCILIKSGMYALAWFTELARQLSECWW